MTENKNGNSKIEVPVLTFDEYQKMISKGKQLPRNYKIKEEEKDRFLKHMESR